MRSGPSLRGTGSLPGMQGQECWRIGIIVNALAVLLVCIVDSTMARGGPCKKAAELKAWRLAQSTKPNASKYEDTQVCSDCALLLTSRRNV